MIRACAWRDASTDLMNIRQKVFIEEQGVCAKDEWDPRDKYHQHFLVTYGGYTVACARLLDSGQIGRIAVLKNHRNRGIGGQILQYIFHYATDNGYPEVFLYAQTHAMPFYQRSGYRPFGDVFFQAGMPHQAMRRHLI